MDQNFLRVDDQDYLLLHIEPCGPGRFRLIAANVKTTNIESSWLTLKTDSCSKNEKTARRR
jgi:hypothetical protein